MSIRLKPVSEQTIVITGATSGIGLATARMAAQKGARLVLAARNAGDLRELEEELRGQGSDVVCVAADVAERDDVRKLAETAVFTFGALDTWINNAGLSIWGRLEDVSEEDNQRLFAVNFWGTVNGSLEAVRHLKQRGGAIINLGSVASERAIPLQGMYSATKHAVKAFTHALRQELEADHAPIAVTLIKPAGVDTPFPEHARNYMSEEPKLLPPVYAPEELAHAILHAAAHQERDIYVGGSGKVMNALGTVAPRLFDRLMERRMLAEQKRDEPARHPGGTLYNPGNGLRVRGSHPGRVMRTSLYTRAALHPWVTGAAIGAAGLAVAGIVASGRSFRF